MPVTGFKQIKHEMKNKAVKKDDDGTTILKIWLLLDVIDMMVYNILRVVGFIGMLYIVKITYWLLHVDHS